MIMPPLSVYGMLKHRTLPATGNYWWEACTIVFFETGEKVSLYLTKDTIPSTKDIGPEHFMVTDVYV